MDMEKLLIKLYTDESTVCWLSMISIFRKKKNGQKQKWLTAFYLFNPEEGFGAGIFVSIDALRT